MFGICEHESLGAEGLGRIDPGSLTSRQEGRNERRYVRNHCHDDYLKPGNSVLKPFNVLTDLGYEVVRQYHSKHYSQPDT